MTPDAWFNALPDAQRPIALALRDLVKRQDARFEEAIKWGQACYGLKSMVCYIQKSKTHVSLGFAKGAVLPDPTGALTGSGTQMRHVKIALGNEIDAPTLSTLINAAIALDQN